MAANNIPPEPIPISQSPVPLSQIDRAPAPVPTDTTAPPTIPLAWILQAPEPVSVANIAEPSIAGPSATYAIAVYANGVLLTSQVHSIDFVGNAVVTTVDRNNVTVTINSTGSDANTGLITFNGTTISGPSYYDSPVPNVVLQAGSRGTATGTVTGASLYLKPGSAYLRGAGNVVVGYSNPWNFNDNTGNLIMPSNTSSINYANGQPYGGSGGGATDWANIGNISNGNGPLAILIGQNAGNQSSAYNLAIGAGAGTGYQGDYAIAIGTQAGQGQGDYTLAIGQGAGYAQQQGATAVGYGAGSRQGANAVAFGYFAGRTTQGANSIAIGSFAGISNQANNSIILNATGANLNQTTANTFTVAPVRNDTGNVTNALYYNTDTFEISYGPAGGGSTGNFVFDGNVVNMPLYARLNSGGVGNTNAAEFGTEVTSNGTAIVSSQIYMGAGTTEVRGIVDNNGAGLMYAGVEGPGFAGIVGMDPDVTSQYAIAVGTGNTILFGAAQPGGTLTTAEYTTGIGAINADGTINGLLASSSNVVISNGNTAGWSFGADGNLSAPGNISTVGTVTAHNLIQAGIGNVNGYNAYFANNITAQGTLQATGLVIPAGSGTFYGNTTTGVDALFAGVPGYTQLGSNVVAQFAANVNSYAQINLQNLSTGDLASADYIITADIGNNSAYYLDLGLASSTHNDPYFFGNVSTANDGYLTVVGPDSAGPSTSAGPGNLILGSSNGLIKMFVGNAAQANVIATVSSTGLDVVGNITTTGTSGNITGANVISANLFVTTGSGGDLTMSGGNVTGANVVTANTFVTSGTANVGAINIPGTIAWPDTSNVFVDSGLHIYGNLGLDMSSPNNVAIIANANTWTFDTAGNLSIPGGGAVWNIGNGTVGITANILNPQTVNLGLDYAGNSATLSAGNIVTIQLATGTQQWNFYGNALMTAPGAISAAGNITGANIITSGSGGDVILTGGNITGANVITANTITANSLFNGTSNISIIANSSIQMFTPAFDTNLGAVNLVGTTNGNSVAPQNPGVMLHLTGVTGTPARIYNDSVANYAGFIGRRYDGTADAPAAISANAVISRYAATPYTSAGWPTISTARIDMVTTEAQTATNQGTEIQFWTTSLGSNTIAKVMSMTNNDIKINGDLATTGNATFSTNPNYVNNITVSGTAYDASMVIDDVGADHVAQLILNRSSTSVQPILATALNNSDDPTANVDVVLGQTLFQLATLGFAGTDYKEFGGIAVRVDDSGTVSETSSPGLIELRVTPDGSTSTNTALTIRNDSSAEFAGNVTVDQLLITTPVTLGTLTAVAGARAFINDANLVAAGNFGAQITGGAGNTVPVWSDGSNWYIG